MRRLYLQGNPSYNLQPVTLKPHYLFRIIGNKVYLLKAKVREYLRAYTIIPEIRFKAKGFIRLYCIEPFILKGICLYLIHKADASAFLPHIEHNSSTLFPYNPHCLAQLFPAIASL